MALYTVSISSAGSSDVVSLTDGSTYAKLEVSAGRGPRGNGWTGVEYDNGTGRFTFTSTDGLGYVSDSITADLDTAVTEAEAAQTAAEAAQAATESIFDQFGDQYLGAKTSDPTVDNDGDPLTEGDIYFNTTDDVLKFYSGTAWVAPESIATTAAAAAQAAQTAAETAETNAETAEANAATSASNAGTFEANAASSASAASTSETNAAISESGAASSASAAAASEAGADADRVAAQAAAATATTKASEASTSEANAATSASTATTKASEAATSATSAATSATESETAKTAAESAKDAALAALDSFDDLYLGQKASDPTLDNDGDALVAGALYFNTTDDVMKVYNGSSWLVAYTPSEGVLIAANNLSDLDSAATARTNLGLGTAATTASTDYATAAQGTLADSAVQPNDSPTFGGLTVDTDTLHVDATNNRVGIGVSSPNATLHVSGGVGIRIEDNFPELTLFDTDVAGLYHSVQGAGNGALKLSADAGNVGADSRLEFFVDNSEAMRINSSGNVGIGKTASTGIKLDVEGKVNANERLTVDHTGAGSVFIGDGLSDSTSNRYVALYNDNGLRLQTRTDAGVFVSNDYLVSTNASGAETHRWQIANSEAMRIDSSGSVGIGTSTPNSGLDVENWVSSTSPSLIRGNGTIPATATGTSLVFDTIGVTYAASTAATTLIHYRARPAENFGAGATLTNQYGFFADNRLTNATFNMGFYSNLGIGTGRWNFYANGDAPNYFAGNVGIGEASPTEKLDVDGTVKATAFEGDGSALTGIAVGAGTVKAWVTYQMYGAATIIADGGVSSLTDLGVGTPQFNLDTALPAAHGSCWNTNAVYSNGSEFAVQSGGRIGPTTAWKGYCGSSTTARADWRLGYSGVIR